MQEMIHQTAIISGKAVIGQNVRIGAYCVIGDKVNLADNVTLHSHVVIHGNTSVGGNCEVFPFAALGLAPQHTRYGGCLLYTSPSPRDRSLSRMPSSA